MNQTTDFMYGHDVHKGLCLHKYKGHICHTVYNSQHHQLFYTEQCNAVFDKEKDQVVELTIDSWTKLTLSIASIQTHYENTGSC